MKTIMDPFEKCKKTNSNQFVNYYNSIYNFFFIFKIFSFNSDKSHQTIHCNRKEMSVLKHK